MLFFPGSSNLVTDKCYHEGLYFRQHFAGFKSTLVGDHFFGFRICGGGCEFFFGMTPAYSSHASGCLPKIFLSVYKACSNFFFLGGVLKIFNSF